MQTNCLDSENWKDIVGYEGLYAISNLGRVKSLSRHYYTGVKNASKVFQSEKLMTAQNLKGYNKVRLCKDGKKFCAGVHRLIAIHFIDNPNNYPSVNHKNGIKTDNRIENLEWCTNKYNIQHAFSTGLKKMRKGNESWHNKPVLAIDPINNRTFSFFNQLEAARVLGMCSNIVNRVLKGKDKTAKGYLFEYI